MKSLSRTLICIMHVFVVWKCISSISGVEVGEGLICIIHHVHPSTLGGSGRRGSFTVSIPSVKVGGAYLHHPQSASLYLGGSGRRGSLASSTVCLPLLWVEVEVGLICIIHSVPPSTLGGGGGGAHLHHPHCASFYLGGSGGRGSFASSTVCLPPHLAAVGEAVSFPLSLCFSRLGLFA